MLNCQLKTDHAWKTLQGCKFIFSISSKKDLAMDGTKDSLTINLIKIFILFEWWITIYSNQTRIALYYGGIQLKMQKNYRTPVICSISQKKKQSVQQAFGLVETNPVKKQTTLVEQKLIIEVATNQCGGESSVQQQPNQKQSW